MEIYYADFNKTIGYDCSNDKKPFYMLNDFVVIIQNNKRKFYMMIKKGFTSDGCTIWKPFRFLLGCPHTPKYLPASIIHDWILDHPEVVKYDRKTASTIFFHALLKEGVSPIQAVIMYLAVDLWQAVKNLWTEKWV